MSNCRAKSRAIGTTKVGAACSIVWKNSSTNNCRSKQGRKMNTEEVVKKVVEFVRKQAWHEAVDALYDKDIVSVEARTQDGSSPETRGIDGVRGKVDWWLQNMEVHSFT